MAPLLAEIIDQLKNKPVESSKQGEKHYDPTWESAKTELNRFSADYWQMLEKNASKVRRTDSGKYSKMTLPLSTINGFEVVLEVYEPTKLEGKLETIAWYALINNKDNLVYQRKVTG